MARGFNQPWNVIRQQMSIHSKKSSKGDSKKNDKETGIVCYQLMDLLRKLREIGARNEKLRQCKTKVKINIQTL